jgi:hypothetical protein
MLLPMRDIVTTEETVALYGLVVRRQLLYQVNWRMRFAHTTMCDTRTATCVLVQVDK